MTYLGDYGAPSLTPNGKWIITGDFYVDSSLTPEFVPTIDIIYNPDNAGLACNMQTHQYNMLNYHFFAYPSNYANFRLGPVDGSSCDTLGLDSQVSVEKLNTPINKIKVYPNPARESITVEFTGQEEFPVNLVLYNSLGQNVLKEQLFYSPASIESLHNLSSGIYMLQLNDNKGQLLKREKLLIVR